MFSIILGCATFCKNTSEMYEMHQTFTFTYNTFTVRF